MATHSSILAWKFHGQRSLASYCPWGCKESDTTEHAHTKANIYSKGNKTAMYKADRKI